MSSLINDLVQGDTLNFTTSVPDYPAGNGWTLTYALRGPSVLDLVATVSGSDYVIQATSAQTAALTPGTYFWAAYVTQSGNRYTVETGTLTVRADISQATAGYDGRTPAKIALDQCQAAMRTFQSSGGLIKSYTIGDRTMTFQDFGALMQLESRLKIQVANEATRDSIAAGLGNPRRLHVRFR